MNVMTSAFAKRAFFSQYASRGNVAEVLMQSPARLTNSTHAFDWIVSPGGASR
jgi:hypothetical protein